MSARVLIIDDLPFMRKLLREVLTEAGFTVVAEAADGSEGVSAYRRLEPDLVLLDITMPVMDGITALRRIIEINPLARVVMCSSLGEQDMILRAVRLGALDFVVKPFRPERVVAALRKALRNHRGAESGSPVQTDKQSGLRHDG